MDMPPTPAPSTRVGSVVEEAEQEPFGLGPLPSIYVSPAFLESLLG